MPLRRDLSGLLARTDVDEASSKEGEMRRLALASVMAAALAGAVAPSAGAAGGPPIFLSSHGITAPGGKSTFDTIHPGGRTTLLRVQRPSGNVIGYARIQGDYTVAAIGTYHQVPTGLSADGSTLVLAQSAQPVHRTSFAIVNVAGQAPRFVRRVTLPGVFGLDGVSPDGSNVYLLQYFPRNLQRYAVRRYDVATGRLAPKPVVDPTDDEQMRGWPLTRVTSPEGRWAYTLYSGATRGKPPFIHALDMAGGGRAKCVDLPKSLSKVGLTKFNISPNGRTLTVSNKRGQTLATVDTRTFQVSTRAAPKSRGAAPSSSSNDFPWLLLALGGGLIVGAASLWGMPRLYRRRLAGTDK
jgi:hypothetical protein